MASEKFQYIYSANGTKLRKYFYEDNRLMETTDYSGMFIYIDDHLDNILTSEGRMKFDDHDSLFYSEYITPQNSNQGLNVTLWPVTC